MNNRYKIVISNNKIYKEIELPVDVTKMTVGTGVNCDIRLRKELFFEQFELTFKLENNQWNVFCSENIFVTTGDILKLVTKPLKHGDELFLKYHNSNADIAKLTFMIDFESKDSNYEKCIDLSGINEIEIGGTSNCQIHLSSQYVGTDSIRLVRKNNKFYLYEKNTHYGVYINQCKKTGEILLNDTDFFALADFSFYLKGQCLYTSKYSEIQVNGLKVNDVSASKSGQVYPHFNRSTRLKMKINEESINVLDPLPIPKKPTGSIILKLLPAVIMFGVTILFRLVLSESGSTYIFVSLISMLLGICTSVAGIVSERKKYKDEVKEREDTYQAYIENKRIEIEESRAYEKELLDKTYYSLDKEIQIINDFTPDLFNRVPEDQDYLEVYLGIGEKKASRQIEYKKQEKFNGQDELTVVPENIATEYRNVKQVPITVDLKNNNVIGVVGKRNYLYGMLKNMTIDLVTRQYYNDVKLFYILDEAHAENFKWLRFLPHVQNPILNSRNIVCDSDSKNIIFEFLYKELTRRSSDKDASYTERYVIFVYSDLGLKRHPISRYIDRAKDLGFSFIFMEEKEEFLPNNCDEIIKLENEMQGKVIISEDSTEEIEFAYKTLANDIAENLVVKLAPVYCDEVSLEGSLTKNITLFELLNILNADDIDLESNWRKSEVYKSLAAPLGVKAKNQVVSLDLNEKHHGPHGLVAGTTGSGKSEIIQSYILSMAVLYHPYEVGFVIIDFKGGGMVNQFADLPHLVGAITNIDGREINRSLSSIKAELRKRQALFAEYGVNHVDAYIKLYKKGEAKIPLPHLILVVDEFAELKMDQPEFMKELISAARIGRSLGIHLILATQKPSGVVDAQIWSNSKFKLCLKVQNKEDSNEVLKTPLAAEIKEPGRAYLQVGNNEIFDLFQSAYSGGPASVDDGAETKAFSLQRVELSGKRTEIYTQKAEKSKEEKETQLSAIVKHVAKYCADNGIEKLPGICLPPLKNEYNYDCVVDFESDEIGLVIPIGIYDDPDHQKQEQLTLNVSENNTFILGSSQYGKTSLLQTIIRGLTNQYTPNEVNIYILDFASMALKVFENLNHVGGVVLPGEDDKLKLFFKMMKKEVKQRKEKFAQMGITSYQAYCDAGNKDLPQIVLLLDNITAFRELCDGYDESLLSLCREGIAVGITIVVTAQQIAGIGYKYLSTFSNKYGFVCNDKSEYGSLYDRCKMEPKNIPGRALACIDKTIYEFQAFLGFEGEKEIQRVQAIKQYISNRNAECSSMVARRIPEVPTTLTGKYLVNTFGKSLDNQYYIGIDFDTVEPVMLNIEKESYIAISGKDNSGRSNYIRYLFKCMQESIFVNPIEAYVIDNYEQKLANLDDYGFVEQYTTDASAFEMILEKVQLLCEMRTERCQEEGIQWLKSEPTVVVVVNNAAIYDASKITKDACGQWKNIVKNYKNMKILFIMAGVENTTVGISSSEILKYFKENKNILFFDELAKVKLTDVPAAIQRQFRNSMEQGDAFYITSSGVVRLRTPLSEE